MHRLAEIQNEIENAIFGKESNLDFIRQNGGISIADRIQVHRDTVMENLINSLKIDYPGIWSLIGEDCAKSAALSYSRDLNNLTTRAFMAKFGANFPEFLKSFLPTKSLQYLPDYAKLEWLKAKSYDAPRQNIVQLEELQSFFDDLEHCHLKFNDSVFFLSSKFPLLDIQHLLDNPDVSNLDLCESDYFFMICRVNNNIKTLSITEKQWKFFVKINSGNTIGNAMEIFIQDEMDSEIAAIVEIMLKNKMIIKIWKHLN